MRSPTLWPYSLPPKNDVYFSYLTPSLTLHLPKPRYGTYNFSETYCNSATQVFSLPKYHILDFQEVMKRKHFIGDPRISKNYFWALKGKLLRKTLRKGDI